MTFYRTDGVVTQSFPGEQERIKRVRVNMRWDFGDSEDGKRLAAHLDALCFIGVVLGRKRVQKKRALKSKEIVGAPDDKINVNEFAERHPDLVASGEGVAKNCAKGIIKGAGKYEHVGTNGVVYEGWFVHESVAVEYYSLSRGDRRYIGKMLKRGAGPNEVYKYIEKVVGGYVRPRARV